MLLTPLRALRLTLPPTTLPLPADEADDTEPAGDDTTAAALLGVTALDDDSGVASKSRAGNSAFLARRCATLRLPSAGRSIEAGGAGDSSRMSRLAFMVVSVWCSVREERLCES